MMASAARAGRPTLLLTHPFAALVRPAWVDEVNATVRAVGAATGTNVVDVATALRSPLYVEVDGFHPNALGHRRIAALVSRAIGAQAQ